MIGGPSTGYYGNTAYTRHGEPQFNANDLIRPFGEAFADLLQGGNRRAQAAEETINLPQTPPQSPKANNHGHPHRLEDRSSLSRRKTTDLGSTQPLSDGDLSDPLMNGLKKSYTYPNTDPAVLFDAIKAGDIATIEKELKNGAALEVTDGFGFTPLWRAVDIGKCSAIKLLLDNGANYDARFNGKTVLQWALDNCKVDIVDMIFVKMDEKLRLGGNAMEEVI